MPLLKYFRSLRAGYRRRAASTAAADCGKKECLEPAGSSDELLAAQKFYAEQETTRDLGDKNRRGKLKKHVSGIFVI